MTRTHQNWIAIGVLIVGTAATIVFTRPEAEPNREVEPPSQAGAAADSDAPLTPPDASPTAAADIGEADADASGPARACDADYAFEKRGQFIALIEAEARECVQLLGDTMELYYSCNVEDGVYEVTLKYQVSGLINKERLPFSAEYRGVKEIDLTKVNVTPLTPTFRNLCRRKAEADRRGN